MTKQELFYKNIAFLRSQKRYTQKEICDIINVSASTYNQWEKGTSLPGVIPAYELASCLNVSVEDFFVPEIEKKYISIRNKSKQTETEHQSMQYLQQVIATKDAQIIAMQSTIDTLKQLIALMENQNDK